MYYVRVEGKSPKGSYSHMRATNLELALDDRDEMVYSAKAQGYGNITAWWLDTRKSDEWTPMVREGEVL